MRSAQMKSQRTTVKRNDGRSRSVGTRAAVRGEAADV
jgi:hypothetical protein